MEKRWMMAANFSPSLDRLLLRDLGEERLLSLIEPFAMHRSRDVVVGFGDDCAVVEPDAVNSQMVLTTDMLVEGTHFLRRPDTNWRYVGRKAAAANISDAAAMGAAPRYLLVSIAAPGDFIVDDFIELFRGIAEEAGRHGASIIGGDTVAAPHVSLSIAVTAFRAKTRHLPLRSESRPGHHVYASGSFGGSRAGLQLLLRPELQKELPPEQVESLMKRHLVPEPRLALGIALASGLMELAMIDISDGLLHEMNLLAKASGVGFRISGATIPLHQDIGIFCAATGTHPLQLALSSGEEYELLFTTPAAEEDVRKLLERAGVNCPLRRIGKVVAGNEVLLFNPDGTQLHLTDETFQHFPTQ